MGRDGCCWRGGSSGHARRPSEKSRDESWRACDVALAWADCAWAAELSPAPRQARAGPDYFPPVHSASSQPRVISATRDCAVCLPSFLCPERVDKAALLLIAASFHLAL